MPFRRDASSNCLILSVVIPFPHAPYFDSMVITTELVLSKNFRRPNELISVSTPKKRATFAVGFLAKDQNELKSSDSRVGTSIRHVDGSLNSILKRASTSFSGRAKVPSINGFGKSCPPLRAIAFAYF